MKKAYYIPTTEVTYLALSTVLCVSGPDLGKGGVTSTGGSGGSSITEGD